MLALVEQTYLDLLLDESKPISAAVLEALAASFTGLTLGAQPKSLQPLSATSPAAEVQRGTSSIESTLIDANDAVEDTEIDDDKRQAAVREAEFSLRVLQRAVDLTGLASVRSSAAKMLWPLGFHTGKYPLSPSFTLWRKT